MSQQPTIHEATHALGFDHTQCRSDRDNYVQMLFNNIQPQYKFAFEKMKTNNQLIPFDFHSVMIYSPKDFSINNQPTIEPKDPKVTLLNANQRNELRKLDIEMIRKFYKC